jgi:predicted dehydrogenase
MGRVGIIGRGWGERAQAPAFREAGLDVVAVVGRDAWRDVIARDDIDLISIVTPPSEHLKMATAALEAGKHVLCEKPTAMDAHEAEQLVAAARAHPKQLALIDHELRFLPAWIEARERMKDAGPMRSIEVRYTSASRANAGREWNWWSSAAEGGGLWGAVGSHFVDTIHFLGRRFVGVQATLHTIITERPFANGMKRVSTDDFDVVNARLDDGIAVMVLNTVAQQDEPATIAIETEWISMRLTGEELLFAHRGDSLVRVAGRPLTERPGNSPGGAFGSGTLELGRALRAALDDGDRNALAPAATFADGLAQQRVLDAARRSNANHGAWEEV